MLMLRRSIQIRLRRQIQPQISFPNQDAAKLSA
jgi:hypothetical protein